MDTQSLAEICFKMSEAEERIGKEGQSLEGGWGRRQSWAPEHRSLPADPSVSLAPPSPRQAQSLMVAAGLALQEAQRAKGRACYQ